VSRFYITTPIYYVNDAPHIGHAYATVNADAIARWHRLIGDDVFFLTGTDEHGLKVAQAAEARGVSPRDWTDRTAQRFIDAWAGLDVAYDDFIRTTEPRHHQAVQQFLQRIYDNGYIELGIFRGRYCVSCEAYYTEAELVDGDRCPIHGSVVIAMEEENYFFKLSAFEGRLLAWYDDQPGAVRPEGKRNEALAFIRGGLRDISITRTSIDWGVKVPWDPAHVFYVWYDALINYLTAIGYGSDQPRFEHWWPAVHHLIGKEIIRFHCVWWPAMCMAAGIDPPGHVFVHGWLLVGGEKLSKTLLSRADDGQLAGNVRLTDIAPDALSADFGVDAVRYHLLRDTPLGADGDFSYEGIVARYNADLANNLGNLLQRVSTVVGSKCAGIGPAPSAGSPLADVAAAAVERASDAWERFAPHEALQATWQLIGAANAELEATEPWKMAAGAEVETVLGSALEVLRIVAVLIIPAMPGTAREIWRRIGLTGAPSDVPLPAAGTWGGYPGGVAVEKGLPLFPRRAS
jgi:methionyl-tRNA synthetase